MFTAMILATALAFTLASAFASDVSSKWLQPSYEKVRIERRAPLPPRAALSGR